MVAKDACRGVQDRRGPPARFAFVAGETGQHFKHTAQMNQPGDFQKRNDRENEAIGGPGERVNDVDTMEPDQLPQNL